MNPLRRALETISAQMGKLSPTQRLLIGSLGVIMLMTLFLVSQYAAKPEMVQLLDASQPEDVKTAAVDYMKTRGIRYDLSGGRVLVEPGAGPVVLAGLTTSGAMPDDMALLFSNMIEQTSWTNPKEINEQIYNVALQNEVSRTLAEFEGVRSATVVIDAPAPHGLGMAVRRPTAAVTLFMDNGRAVSQKLVDAVAAFVSGAKAGLEIDRVRVIDGANGRQLRASDEDDMIASSYLEHATKVEQQTKRKLDELLGYIPGVIVAVTAEVDVTKRTSQTLRHLPNTEGSVSIVSRENVSNTSRSEASGAARPGVQANTGADLQRVDQGGDSFTEDETDTEFENRFGTESVNVVDPRGMPTRVAASINVPSSYIASLIAPAEGEEGAAEGDGGGAGGTPDAAAIDQRFAQESERIRQSVLPHLPRVVDAEGNAVAAGDVVVSLMPGDGVVLPVGQQPAGMLGGALAVLTGSPGGSMSAGLDKVALLLLAVVAVAMMMMTVKKAGTAHALPSAEELTGLPPALETGSDMVGEAGEGEAPMAGIELGESDVTGQQMLEQVRALVEADPEFTSRLLKRWIQPE